MRTIKNHYMQISNRHSIILRSTFYIYSLSLHRIIFIFFSLLFSFPVPALLQQTLVAKLPPAPSKFHYIFNLKDLSKICCGMLMIHPSLFTTPKQLVRVWRNEFTRVVCDRLVNEQVRNPSSSFFVLFHISWMFENGWNRKVLFCFWKLTQTKIGKRQGHRMYAQQLHSNVQALCMWGYPLNDIRSWRCPCLRSFPDFLFQFHLNVCKMDYIILYRIHLMRRLGLEKIYFKIVSFSLPTFYRRLRFLYHRCLFTFNHLCVM